MKISSIPLSGVYIIDLPVFFDTRGRLVKTFSDVWFKKNNLCTNFKENFYSVSFKNTIRGMHFQLPPMDHAKFVYVPKGRIIDVILDLRKNSKTYGKFIDVEVSDKNNIAIYIDKGFAHGFKALENNTFVFYSTSKPHSKTHDCGIRWDSFGYDWKIKNPIMSEKDK
ncbi:MAG: dTDP-4-dehydrorhamnose 3,5-epimerase family protein, partial [Candidatus Omnitrophota bacterium]